MKHNYTHLIIVLDESGSMSLLQDATIEGVNSLISKQKQHPGDLTTSLYKFSSVVQEVDQFRELNTQNYIPGGCTVLLDALCTAIVNEGKKLASMQEHERPDKVVVLVVTDGEENASSAYNLEDVKREVARQKDTYSWEFVFLGANIDAFSVGHTYGFNVNSTLQWVPTTAGVKSSYTVVDNALTNYRSGVSSSVDFTKAPVS